MRYRRRSNQRPRQGREELHGKSIDSDVLKFNDYSNFRKKDVEPEAEPEPEADIAPEPEKVAIVEKPEPKPEPITETEASPSLV